MIKTDLLRQYPFFSVFNSEQLQTIAQIAEDETYEPGSLLFAEKQPAGGMYILLKGSIELFYTVEVEYRPELRKELVFTVIKPGELFGISTLIEPHIFTSTARVISTSRVVKINAAQLLEWCEKDYQLASALVNQVAQAAIERLTATRKQLAAAWAAQRT
ncbi:MAG TPA: Crp/Fnr family transcriptional regulator [Anaerolineales bacterium]|nr:Crp/Fnr family transcriptional regulator [Anaerolineales bacterium]